ncbi:hypothetical protein NW754_013920 [Fusarium falciforme]|nr:hypothetical protein NW754_013920 [Fusarium falciforme]
MTNVTFRQIVEIFDLLVKNQDPDGSKTLYTYLFTKPNTEKRLESLIESATAGKGLDEVIHLFESPMPAASTLMEADIAVDGLHEELDAFDSPEDEGQPDEAETAEHDEENSREAGLDTNVEVSTTHGDAEDEHDDGNVTTEPTTENPANAGTYDETVTETSHHPDAVAEDENSERNAPVDSEADPFADLELDVGAEDDDEVDLGDDAVPEEQVAVELETAHARTNDTSTTATLKDEDETGSINVDLSADATEEGTAEKTGPNEENDLDEIDWRDEPEVDDEGPSTPSAAGKRARGDDDEVDAEDEQDVKRRRP